MTKQRNRPHKISTTPRRHENGVNVVPHGSPQFLRPFLLGVIVTLLLVILPPVVGFFWICRDVDFQQDISTTTCPSLVVKTIPPSTESEDEKKGKGLFNILGFRKQKGQDQDPKSEYLILLEDPIVTTCRSIINVWSVTTAKARGRQATATENSCSPKVVVHDSSIIDNDSSSSMTTSVSQDGNSFQTAYTNAYLSLTPEERRILLELKDRVLSQVSDWNRRVTMVPWGGGGGGGRTSGSSSSSSSSSSSISNNDSYAWFAPSNSGGGSELERIDGGILFYSYLRIMTWPSDLVATFPFKLCTKGCPSEFALGHTLTFRESFMPWAVSPSTIMENSKGIIFHHGFSPGFDERSGGHSLVWVRPGQRTKVDDKFTMRAYVNALEQAVTASLRNSNGRVGKFNIILDGHNFSFGLMPSLHQLKVFVTILQDHFPDRLGIIMLTNLGRVGEILVGIIRPIISEEVRQKIVLLPRDGKTREAMLHAVVGRENVPKWLGGRDTFEFDSNKYYANSLLLSDEESLKYATTMPYHT